MIKEFRTKHKYSQSQLAKFVEAKNLDEVNEARNSAINLLNALEVKFNADLKSPVPSYEEWRELSKQRNQLIRDVKDLAYIKEESKQLKKLLEKSRKAIIWCDPSKYISKKELMDLLSEIDKPLYFDNAIGEK